MVGGWVVGATAGAWCNVCAVTGTLMAGIVGCVVDFWSGGVSACCGGKVVMLVGC